MAQTAALRLLAVTALTALGTGAAQADTINVFNWSDYIGETTLEDFTAATGTDVNYRVYDNNEVVEAQLMAGNAGYDIVVPTAIPFAARQIQAGVYQKLDPAQIPNLANLDPTLMEQVRTADPTGEYLAIYQWGTTGLGYNVDQIAERMPDAPTDSYDLIFKPENAAKFADCGIALLDSPSDLFPIALNYLGLDPSTESADDLAQAEALLLSIRPYIKYFHSSQYINDLANGDVCIAIGYSGDIIQAQTRAVEAGNGVDVAYVIPKEGTHIWFDVLAVPVDAPNPAGAFRFIDFVLQPEVMAGITNYVAYANAVPASLEFVDEAIRTDPGIFPDDATKANLFATSEVSASYDRLRTRSWTRIRTGQ